MAIKDVTDTRTRAKANSSTPLAIATKLSKLQMETLRLLAIKTDARKVSQEAQAALYTQGLIDQVNTETGEVPLTALGAEVLRQLSKI